MTIVAAPPVEKHIPRKCLWHRHFVLWAPCLVIEGQSGSYHVRCEMMLRRWSATYRCWRWAIVGTVTEGTRDIVMVQKSEGKGND